MASGCGGDDCGPNGAAANGLVASSVETTLTYGSMISRAGNDCPGDDPSVVSLSIEGKQSPDPTMGFITFCIPRPDKLDAGSHTLGTSQSMADVRIIDVVGAFDNCTFKLDSTRPPSGEATGTGVCGNGTDANGFALILDGAISLLRKCGSTTDSVAVTLTGTVAVHAE